MKSKWLRENPQLHNPAGTFDYYHQEVRDRIEGFVRELAERPDVDGICLDYSRIGPFFAPEHVEPGRQRMTDMVRRCREIVDRASQARGCKVMLNALDYPDMQQSYNGGLDLPTWFKEGLLDQYVPFGRGNAPDMDITEYVEATKGTQCEIYGGMGRYHRPVPMIEETSTVPFTMEELRGMAHRFYQSGADGIHLYDTFVPGHNFNSGQQPLPLDYLHTLGDRDGLMRANKRYLTNTGVPVDVGLLNEGGQTQVTVLMAEDIASARRAGIVPTVRLLMDIHTNDPVGDVRVTFNGHEVNLEYGPEPSAWPSLPLTVAVPCVWLPQTRANLRLAANSW